MVREFISVSVKRKSKYENWYIDVTNLNVEQLIELKEELIGKCNVYGIEKAIEKRFCSNIYFNRNARDNKRDNIAMARRRHRHR